MYHKTSAQKCLRITKYRVQKISLAKKNWCPKNLLGLNKLGSKEKQVEKVRLEKCWLQEKSVKKKLYSNLTNQKQCWVKIFYKEVYAPIKVLCTIGFLG